MTSAFSETPQNLACSCNSVYHSLLLHVDRNWALEVRSQKVESVSHLWKNWEREAQENHLCKQFHKGGMR